MTTRNNIASMVSRNASNSLAQAERMLRIVRVARSTACQMAFSMAFSFCQLGLTRR